MMNYANISKFIIYFSFFDCGAIALKEIQNFGVISFSHQKDLVNNINYGFYIPELAYINNMKPAYDKIIKIIQEFNKNNPNMNEMSIKNQKINQCKNALDQLCKQLKKLYN